MELMIFLNRLSLSEKESYFNPLPFWGEGRVRGISAL